MAIKTTHPSFLSQSGASVANHTEVLSLLTVGTIGQPDYKVSFQLKRRPCASAKAGYVSSREARHGETRRGTLGKARSATHKAA